MTKFCRDCVHCVVKDGDYEYAKCHHPRIGAKKVNRVTGEANYWYCSTLRDFDHPNCSGWTPVDPAQVPTSRFRRLWRKLWRQIK